MAREIGPFIIRIVAEKQHRPVRPDRIGVQRHVRADGAGIRERDFLIQHQAVTRPFHAESRFRTAGDVWFARCVIADDGFQMRDLAGAINGPVTEHQSTLLAAIRGIFAEDVLLIAPGIDAESAEF